MAAIRRKQRLWRSAKKGKNVEDYEAADKEVKRLIRNAKRNFEKRLACQNGGNSRPFYAYIKQRTKTRPSIGPLKNANKETVSEDQGMAELLNNFLSSVFMRGGGHGTHPESSGHGDKRPGRSQHHRKGSEG
jgi:hypothetical protein